MHYSTEHPDNIAYPLLEKSLADAEPSALLDQAANIAIRLTAAPSDYLGPATEAMKTRAAQGEKIAAAIRALHVTATPAAATQVVADERAARIESVLARLLASDPITAACSEDDLSAAVNDASAPPFVREQAAAMLAARAALAASPVQPVAVPEGVAEPTYMTEEQGRDWAWKDVKKDVGTKGWTAGDNGHFFGFFVHGWNYRGQFEKQRFAAPAAQGDAKDAERLRWLAETGARISWSMDGEYCAVWLPDKRDGTESRPAEGYPLKCYDSWHRAIDAAIAAKAAS